MIGDFDRHQQGKIGRRPIHGGDADRGRALDTEAEARPGAEPDIEAAGRQPLLELGIAAEARHRDVEPFLLKILASIADLGGAEGKGIRHRLAKPDGVERDGRGRTRRDRRRSKRE